MCGDGIPGIWHIILIIFTCNKQASGVPIYKAGLFQAGLFFVLLWFHFGCAMRMIFYESSLFIAIFSANTFLVGMVNLRSYLSVGNTIRPVNDI